MTKIPKINGTTLVKNMQHQSSVINLEEDGYYVIDGVLAELFQSIDGIRTREELIESILEETEVEDISDPSELEARLHAFFDELQSLGIITEV